MTKHEEIPPIWHTEGLYAGEHAINIQCRDKKVKIL
jgi:hypothetical protein